MVKNSGTKSMKIQPKMSCNEKHEILALSTNIFLMRCCNAANGFTNKSDEQQLEALSGDTEPLETVRKLENSENGISARLLRHFVPIAPELFQPF